MVELLIFNNGEGVIDERPTQLSDGEISRINNKISKDIIGVFDLSDGGDMESLMEDVLGDVENINFDCDGYEVAKEMEDMGYEINTRIVDYLDSVQREFDIALNDKIKYWVSIKKLTPKFEIGHKLSPTNEIRNHRGSRYKEECYYVVKLYDKEGKYVINSDRDSEYGYIVTYEFLEDIKNFT